MATKPSLRRSRSLVIDEAIVDATVEVVRANGPDSLNLSEVARLSGVTTGAVYARYESREELLVDVWQRRSGPLLYELLSQTARGYGGEVQAAAAAATLIDARDKRLLVAFSLLVMARRVEELREVAIRDLAQWFRDEPDWLRALLAASYVLGAVGFDSILDAPYRPWSVLLEWSATLNLATPNPERRVETVAPDALAEIVDPQTGDDARDALLVSMSSVVARSGLARATTARVARGAGYPHSAVFALWPTRADLVAEWAPVALQGIVRSTAAFGPVITLGEPSEVARGLEEVLGSSYRLARQMRLELLLAASSDPNVAAVILESDTTSLEGITQHDAHRRMLAEAVRAVVLGLVLLEETVGGMSTLDLEPAMTPLLRELRQLAEVDERLPNP
jgi:AcrR family transcriptional regulator